MRVAATFASVFYYLKNKKIPILRPSGFCLGSGLGSGLGFGFGFGFGFGLDWLGLALAWLRGDERKVREMLRKTDAKSRRARALGEKICPLPH